jgi:hypothetical protein
MILAFYWPASKLISFAVRQYGGGLVMERESQASLKNEIYVGTVLSSLKPVLVTITSSESGTATYANGTLIKNVPSFVLSSQALTGQ